MRKFDRKFGAGFLREVPSKPGVYRIFDASGAIIYIGKAKNLRRRLSQYRNARRCRRHYKMRAIVSEACSVEFSVLACDLDACLEETRLIQELRPKWNVAGAFSFLYPLIGMKVEGARIFFCLTTLPEEHAEFKFFGAYRSRYLTGEGFFALMRLLRFVGNKRVIPSKKFSYLFSFSGLPDGSPLLWESFFKGESREALESLSLRLLESSSARAMAEEVQEKIDRIRRFWKHEAQRLAQAIHGTGHATYPVTQKERDLLFLRFRMKGT